MVARGDGGLLAPMGAGDFHSFLTDFRSVNTVRFGLGAGGHGDWILNLHGSSAAADELMRCVPRLS